METTRWNAPSVRKPTGPVLETPPQLRQLPTPSSRPPVRHQVVQRSVPRLLLRLRPLHQIGHINARCAISPSDICQSWPATRGYTLVKSHTNVTHVIKASASLLTWPITSVHTVLSGHINVLYVRRVLSTVLTLCGTCMLIRASTCSSAICVRCTLRSRQSSCTINASQKGKGLSDAVLVGRASSARLICGNMNAPTRRSDLSSARSARWASNSNTHLCATVALTKIQLIALSSVTSVIRDSFSHPTCFTISRFMVWKVCSNVHLVRSLSASQGNSWGTNVVAKWRSPTSVMCAAKVTKRIQHCNATRTLTAQRSHWNALCVTSALCHLRSLFSTAVTQPERSPWNVPTVKSASGTRPSCSATAEFTLGRSLSSVPAVTRASSNVSIWPSTRACTHGRHSLSVCGVESVLLTSQLCRSTLSSTLLRVRVSQKLPASHELPFSLRQQTWHLPSKQRVPAYVLPFVAYNMHLWIMINGF